MRGHGDEAVDDGAGDVDAGLLLPVGEVAGELADHGPAVGRFHDIRPTELELEDWARPGGGGPASTWPLPGPLVRKSPAAAARGGGQHPAADLAAAPDAL